MNKLSQELQIKWLPEKKAENEIQHLKEELRKAEVKEQQMLLYIEGMKQIIRQNPELHRQIELFSAQFYLTNT